MATETKTFYPGEYDASASNFYKMTDGTNPVGKGSANNTYATFTCRAYNPPYVYWPFDVSIIPAEAIVDSVACTAKCRCDGTHGGSVQLYAGTVAKGSATAVNGTVTARNLSCGTWTRAELASIRLRTDILNPGSILSFYFYGADLTVTYTYQSEKFMLKLSGDYEDVARTFKRVSGIWVEQTDLANVIEDGVRYQNGGEYVDPTPTINFTIGGVSYKAEEGMTWGEWVASSYNTHGYLLNSDNRITIPVATVFVTAESGRNVKASDVIIAGHTYTLNG